ncbi:MAG: DUF87 domain-containing protein, partial [Candidatus Portnoybacteria bacterium]|nr:DUF87 domain-containing protein [Candidatus Portnoybacteria bacterium]
MDPNLILVPLTVGLGICLLGLGAWLIVETIKGRGNIFRSLNMGLFLVTLPRAGKPEPGQPPKNEKELISVMEQLYSSLASFKDKPKDAFIYGPASIVFEMAVPNFGQEISFYLAVSKRVQNTVEKQIQGFFPEAHLEKIKDYNIFNPQGASAGSYISLGKSFYLPFKTYKDLEVDPMSAIVNAFGKLHEEGEGAAIQMIFKSSFGWQKRALKIAREMQKNKSFNRAISASSGLARFFSLLNPPSQAKKQTEIANQSPQMLTPLAQEQIKAIEGKASKVGFEVNLRFLTSASTQIKAEGILAEMEGAFAQFNHPSFNELKISRCTGSSLKKLIYDFSFRIFNPRQKMIISTEELTSLFHFPTGQLAAPQFKFLKAKQAAAPANLPKQGLLLGKNVFRNEETEARLAPDDRRRHLYIIGQTGTGKSTFIANLAIQDVLEGRGIGVIDPHGDLVEKIISLIPPERADDLILIDPGDLERPVGLNMLEYDPHFPEQKTFIVNELINIFDKLYDLRTTGGPIFEQYTRNALLLLLDDPEEGATLMEVPKILSDKQFRLRLLAKCKNPVVKDFWEKEAEKAGGEASLQNLVPYITSKFNVFIANDYMRPIIGQAKSTINYRQIMDEKKILLVNLSKGRLGDINSNLLGLLNVGKILMSAFSRVDIAEDQRQDFYLYIDEFQNFATESIATILSEARKYRLSLTIAHQFIGQLNDKIKASVFGNVGSIVAFRVGA